MAAIAAMAKALGLDLIAEGVETVEHRDSLGDLGCRHAQGHLFAQAQPADAMSQLLAKGRLLPGTIGLSGQQAGRTAAG